jgi:hypothetical protein
MLEDDLPFTLQNNIADILLEDNSDEDRLMTYRIKKQQCNEPIHKKNRDEYITLFNSLKKEFNKTLSNTKKTADIVNNIDIKMNIINEKIALDFPDYKYLTLFNESYIELQEAKNSLMQINNEINVFYNNTTTLLYELNENTLKHKV